ncbi:hypothetical protein EI94DRAFT_214739 [Lactarius quietus]|nr:hypothetical protein EI94DRAFT_214739 [Lactarius quietus]
MMRHCPMPLNVKFAGTLQLLLRPGRFPTREQWDYDDRYHLMALLVDPGHDAWYDGA